MKTLRYMGHAMGLLLRSAMQYRASFLMQTLSQAVMTGGDLLAVAVLSRISIRRHRERREEEP